MAKKIDPLNKKNYGAVSVSLIVNDIPAAMKFYQRGLGFAKRSSMNGPNGKPIHAELTLRGTVLMLSPEAPSAASAARRQSGLPRSACTSSLKTSTKQLPRL